MTDVTSALRERVARLGADLCALDASGVREVDLVALLGELESLKCRVEGAQVAAAAALDSSVRAAHAAAGVPLDRQGQGVGLQVALARRESHHRGERQVGLARVLTRELPCTLAALRVGLISEWRATVVARETACLSLEHRAVVDQELGDAPEVWARWGERELVGELRRLAYRLDPESVVARCRRAQSQRSVSLRPAPDAMTYLTALLAVATGVGVFAELTRAADAARAAGDERGRGPVMADTLATRLLGQPDSGLPRVPVTVNVVVSDEVLLGQSPSEDTAVVQGYGVVPGGLVRQLAGAGLDAAVQLRRLYATPDTGALVAMESRSRCFPPALAEFIRLRDRTCRTPWCDAPVRHVDHVRAHADGGLTTADNGQGLCEACNQAKAAPGWAATTTGSDKAAHTVTLTTPTGATYDSTAPPAPRPLPRGRPGRDRVDASRLEWHLEVMLEHAN
ncbi:MAG: DUF222 domain-containing protein [Rhodoferax sp.]|nr:DUF222 domain-containing protein [Actinomycetota bacterium]